MNSTVRSLVSIGSRGTEGERKLGNEGRKGSRFNNDRSFAKNVRVHASGYD